MQAYPYENLSKIHRAHNFLHNDNRPRSQDIFLQEAIELGTGGTCFALTHHLHNQLKQCGFPSRFIMGDKYSQKNIHCALLYKHDNTDFLLDPGYMIYTPLQLPTPTERLSFRVDPNDITLFTSTLSSAWVLCTGAGKTVQERFSLRQETVEEKDFFDFWRASFSLPMMGYPVLNCLKDGVQYYLQKNMLLSRSRSGSDKKHLNSLELRQVINDIFNINPDLTEKTLTHLGY